MEQVAVGIDVSARTFDVRARSRSGEWTGTFDNDARGHRRLIAKLTKKRGRGARVCLEATGVYHLDLALALHATERIEVMVVNPRRMKDFSRANGQRSKHDRADAASALEYLERMPFQPWQPPSRQRLELRTLARRIQALKTQQTQERNRRHAAGVAEALPAVLVEDLDESIEQLGERIQRLLDQALQVIAADPELDEAFARVLSIRGFGETSAVQVLGELLVLPADMTPKQWVAHAGLDPRHHDSGTSIHKRARISREGNRHLRRALFMPALVAAQHEPSVRRFYQELVERGKPKLVALVAVMRKLLHSLNGMLRHHTDFDGERFRASAPTA